MPYRKVINVRSEIHIRHKYTRFRARQQNLWILKFEVHKETTALETVLKKIWKGEQVNRCNLPSEFY
jgi:hypothetical protein